MAPSHLQGLNLVHPSTPTPSYLSDADLLSLPPFPDLNAQLDLWTNLNFQSDEPLALPLHGSSKSASSSDSKHRRPSSDSGASDDDPERYNDQDDDAQSRAGIAETAAHENVVTGTVLPPTGVAHSGHPASVTSQNPNASPAGAQLPLDLNSLLAGIGIDPFLIPPVQQAAAQSANASSIAQLLQMHAATFLPPHMNPGVASPLSQSAPALSTHQQQHQSQPQQRQQPTPPASKRTRTARSSFSSIEQSPPASPDVSLADEKDSATPMTAAEDKRRRNTAASARFRLKKKEREAALERKAKELEVRVSELEKECEALRRENGWLKGLVVGVTGVGAVQQQQAVGTGTATATATGQAAGTKRSRAEAEAGQSEK